MKNITFYRRFQRTEIFNLYKQPQYPNLRRRPHEHPNSPRQTGHPIPWRRRRVYRYCMEASIVCDGARENKPINCWAGSWWLPPQSFRSSAKLIYSRIYCLPREDICVAPFYTALIYRELFPALGPFGNVIILLPIDVGNLPSNWGNFSLSFFWIKAEPE